MSSHCFCPRLSYGLYPYQNFKINEPWQTTNLKTSKVTSISKKSSKLKCFIYRPMSLLFNLDKMLKGIVYNRLYKFIEENNLIYNSQLRFLSSVFSK